MPLSITSSAGLMILTTAARLRWPPTRSPGCAASSIQAVGGRVPLQRLRGRQDQRAARREQDELFDWAAAYAEEHFVDLLEIVKAHYFGVSGLGSQADGAACGVQLARRRSRRAELAAVVRRGGARGHC